MEIGNSKYLNKTSLNVIGIQKYQFIMPKDLKRKGLGEKKD